jgi:DNA-binding XRE family transcriptional regulator
MTAWQGSEENMKREKRTNLEAAGWAVGTAADFLGLTPEEQSYIELKLALGQQLRKKRELRSWTQATLAERLGSSQSRVAKMEGGDPGVSIDLLLKALLAAGATKREIAEAIKR